MNSISPLAMPVFTFTILPPVSHLQKARRIIDNKVRYLTRFKSVLRNEICELNEIHCVLSVNTPSDTVKEYRAIKYSVTFL